MTRDWRDVLPDYGAVIARLEAEVAHRDRAIEHMGWVLSGAVPNSSPREWIESTMQITRNAPAVMPPTKIAPIDVSALLRALDDLTRALRGKS